MRRIPATHRRKSPLVVSIVLTIALGIAWLPAVGASQSAQTAQIAFLNPSSFASAGERGIIVSDNEPDAGRGCCTTISRVYHLSAWVANAPSDARVFFGIKQEAVDLEVPASPAPGTDTWESEWTIPNEVLDGPATLFAYLVVDGAALATDEQSVTILRLQENASINYPRSGGALGSYAALATTLPIPRNARRQTPKAVLDTSYTATPDVSYLRSFYTISPVGSDPQWKVCGTEPIGESSASLNRADDGVRCVLDSATEQDAITAVAAVANDSPDSYDIRFNQSGDVVPVGNPYAQVPTLIRFSESSHQVVEPSALSETEFPCSSPTTVRLTDQEGRSIAGVNMDVHAWGPDDRVAFDTSTLVPMNRVPDRGSHNVERAFDCTQDVNAALPSNADPGSQGRHYRFGLSDRKHVESLPVGTSDEGTFSFRLHSDREGSTEFVVWVDEFDDGCSVDDDALTEAELFVTGGVDWGASHGFFDHYGPEPLITCVPVDQSPSPSPAVSTSPISTVTPTPSISPSEPPVFDGSRDVTLRLARPTAEGSTGSLKGRVLAADKACAANQDVFLRIRRPGRAFYARQQVVTAADGKFEIRQRLRAPRDYRVVAPATSICDRAVSEIIRLRRR